MNEYLALRVSDFIQIVRFFQAHSVYSLFRATSTLHDFRSIYIIQYMLSWLGVEDPRAQFVRPFSDLTDPNPYFYYVYGEI